MLAQKTSNDCKITAFDIDQKSVNCSIRNFRNSNWNHRLNCFKWDVSQCKEMVNPLIEIESFDLIISNPPYFSRQLNAQNEFLSRSKHQSVFDFKVLAEFSARMLKGNGITSFVIPVSYLDELCYQMYLNRLQLRRLTKVCHYVESENSLALVEFGKSADTLKRDILVLYNTDGTRSLEYSALTSAYYL
jgi:tRNA1Val (adenine37-N6)-methyltransferase